MGNNGNSILLNSCAAKHGVTNRTARNWRDAGDKRWLDYVEEKRTGKADKEVRKEGRKGLSLLEVPGLRSQLECIEIECKALARRMLPNDKGDEPEIDVLATVSRMLDQKREVWRKLAKDLPPIENESGESLPVDQVIRYSVEIRGLIDTLPSRIALLMPSDLSLEIKRAVEDEIASVLELASQVSITGGDE